MGSFLNWAPILELEITHDDRVYRNRVLSFWVAGGVVGSVAVQLHGIQLGELQIDILLIRLYFIRSAWDLSLESVPREVSADTPYWPKVYLVSRRGGGLSKGNIPISVDGTTVLVKHVLLSEFTESDPL